MIKKFNMNEDSMDAWAEVVERVKREVPCTVVPLTRAKKNTYVCDVCGSGTGPNGTGMHYYPDTNKMACWGKCAADAGKKSKDYDNIDLWMIHHKVDFKTAVKELAELGNIPLPDKGISGGKAAKSAPARTTTEPIKKEAETAQIKPKTDYSEYFRECAARLEDPAAIAYLDSRGISAETARRFNLGFDPEADPANKPGAAAGTWKPHPAPRVIIPMGKYSYVGRRTDGKEGFEKLNADEGQIGLTVSNNFRKESGAVFVTEGGFDALSIMEATPETRAISLNSKNNTDALIKAITADKDAFINGDTGEYWPIIICMDNDEPGRQAQSFLLSELKKLGLPCIGTTLNAEPGEDPNDILINYGKEELRKRILWAVESIKNMDILDDFGEIDPDKIFDISDNEDANANYSLPEDNDQAPENAVDPDNAGTDKLAEDAGAAADPAPQEDKTPTPPMDPIDQFLAEIKSRRFEPIETGVYDVDRALHGGLMRRTLVTLAAAPGAGKTAFAQWIFENMAASGHDVIFLNLEMDRAQLLARSISRLAWRMSEKKNGAAYSVLNVLRGYDWTPAQESFFLPAVEEYRKRIAPHFMYNPDELSGSDGNDIDKILEVVRKETKRIKDAGRPEPIICIDYLQLVYARADTTAESIQYIIKALKDFAVQNNTIVFLISAQNRASNKAGISEMESGRDTSAIEYSGDLMLGLVYTAIENGETWDYIERDADGKTKTDKNGAPIKKKVPYDVERIRQLKRQAYDEGTPEDPVCNRITLKVLKNRFGEAERRANFIFDGKHATFNLIEDERNPKTKNEKRGEWIQGELDEVTATF